MSSTEIRTHVTPQYPGSFWPESGERVRVEVDPLDTAAIAALFADDPGWFCLEVTTATWRLWTSDGQQRWMPEPGPTSSRRIYVGQALTADDVAALDGDHAILLSNMRGNGWDRVVRTRAGNFQPLGDGDVVLAAA